MLCSACAATPIEHDGETFDREIITHPGAVAVVALDEEGGCSCCAQYRHAAQRVMIEIPAGLLDVEGEPPLEAAKRELREEGLLEADRWTPLFEMRTSPGASTEIVHLFLAEGLRAVDVAGRVHASTRGGEHDAVVGGLSELVEAVLAGRVSNSLTVAGSLAVDRLAPRKTTGLSSKIYLIRCTEFPREIVPMQ